MIVVNRWLENSRKSWADVKDTQYYDKTLEQLCQENYDLGSSGLEWLFNLYDMTTKWVNSAHIIQEWNRDGHYTLKYDTNAQCGYLECKNQGVDSRYYSNIYTETTNVSDLYMTYHDAYFCQVRVGSRFAEELENATDINIKNLYIDIVFGDKISGGYVTVGYSEKDINVDNIDGIFYISKKIADETYENFDFPSGPYPMYDRHGVIEYYYDKLSVKDILDSIGISKPFRSGDTFYRVVDTGLKANIAPYGGGTCYNIETICTQKERFVTADSNIYSVIQIELTGRVTTPYQSNLTISKNEPKDTFNGIGFSPKKQTTPDTIFDFEEQNSVKIGYNTVSLNIYFGSIVKKDTWTNYSLDPKTFIYYKDTKIPSEGWKQLFNTLGIKYDGSPMLSSDETYLNIAKTFLTYDGDDNNVVIIRFKTPSGDDVVDFYVHENLFINTKTKQITDTIPLGQACYAMDGLKCFLWKSPELTSKTLKEIIESNYCMMDSIYLIDKADQPTIPETYIDSNGYTRKWSDLKDSAVISVPEYNIQDKFKITVLSFSDNKQETLTDDEKDGQYFNQDLNNTKYWGTTPVHRAR